MGGAGRARFTSWHPSGRAEAMQRPRERSGPGSREQRGGLRLPAGTPCCRVRVCRWAVLGVPAVGGVWTAYLGDFTPRHRCSGPHAPSTRRRHPWALVLMGLAQLGLLTWEAGVRFQAVSLRD